MPRCVCRCSAGHHMVTSLTQHAGKRIHREGIWMNGTEIYSHFSSRLPQTVACVVYPAGWSRLTLSADIESAVDRSITGIGSSKCRRNGKVLTTRTLRNLRLQDAATKVRVMIWNDSVKVELLLPKCMHMIFSGTVFDVSAEQFLSRNHRFIAKWEAPGLSHTLGIPSRYSCCINSLSVKPVQWHGHVVMQSLSPK